MTALLLLPATALALLAAHFYRAAQWPLASACVLLLVLMFAWRRPWVARLLQIGLLAGAAEWLWTTLLLVQQRLALGQPWLRMAVILSVVMALTAASAAVFSQLRVRQRYRRS